MNLARQSDPRKDKRLLVLLAFGALFLLPHVAVVLPDRQPASVSWIWREHPDDAGLYRIRIPAAGPATAEERDGGAGDNGPALSPRLALLLGWPFPINRAGEEELALLDGIGPKLAAAIAGYRDRHGRIDNEQGLRAVPGIGARLAARIAPQLSFE